MPSVHTSRHGGLASLNLQSFGRAFDELLPQNNLIPRLAYFINFARQKTKLGTELEGFSVVLATRNRRQFLACAVAAVVSNTKVPFELIIMDNASSDGTYDMCQTLEAQYPGVVRHVRLNRNLGTNAYALGFLQARYKYLVDMDDDVLALSKGWDRATIDAFADSRVSVSSP